jgi:hypothetical protein
VANFKRSPQGNDTSNVRAAINACESKAAIDDAAVVTQVIEGLLRTAGVEYQVGIIDGAVNNLHEYQDAWGFTQIAADWAQSSAFAKDGTAASVAAQVQATIRELSSLWPSLDPQGTVDGDAAQLFGAAGQVSVAAAALNR